MTYVLPRHGVARGRRRGRESRRTVKHLKQTMRLWGGRTTFGEAGSKRGLREAEEGRRRGGWESRRFLEALLERGGGVAGWTFDSRRDLLRRR